MQEDPISIALFIGGFLFLSALFSSSESALFSIPYIKVEQFKNSKNVFKRLLYRLLVKPRKLLITIVFGNMFVNIFLSSEIHRLLWFLDERYRHIVTIGVATPLIIVFGEIFPKLYGIRYNERWSMIVSPFLFLFSKFIFFIVGVTDFLTVRILRFIGVKDEDKEEEKLFLGSIRAMVRGGGIGGGFKETGYETFIRNIINLKDLEARHIMIPRNKVFFVPLGIEVSKAVNMFLDNEYDRAPVYKDSYDNVVGILDYKVLLPYVWNVKRSKGKKGVTITKSMLEPAYIYPENIKVFELYKHFREKGIKMAIMIDDYGGVSGIVTFKDLTSVIFGDIYGSNRKIGMIKKKGDYFVLSGDFRLSELQNYIPLNIVEYQSETIDGLIVEKLGKLPSEGDVFIDEIIPNTEIKILKVNKGRVERVALKVK